MIVDPQLRAKFHKVAGRIAVVSVVAAFLLMFSPRVFSAADSKIDGLWDATVLVGQAEIPFRFEIATTGNQVQGFFFEGEKKIGSTSGQFVNNQLILQYEFLYTTLTATFDGEQFQGTYRRNRKNAGEYPFRAHRFRPAGPDSAEPPQVAGAWEMALVGEDHSAIKDPRSVLSWNLYLRQSGQEVSGAILRVDGDTGTLTGRWHGKTLVLSHFAGDDPVLFEASLQPDGTLDVTYNRANKYVAARVSEARAKGIPEPPDPFRFTTVNNPSEPFQFAFPDLSGKTVSSSDAQFSNKVVLVTIGGTWCPNCRDEAPLLVELYKEYHARGLEIVSLNFEAAGDPSEDLPRIASFLHEFAIPYPVLLAGAYGEVLDKLPQLVNFGAYPTTLFLGRDGRVRAVHAGFASSATGEASTELARETRATIERLLAEPSNSSRASATATDPSGK
jgi:thiol-disulfide isomerase/thioredoxin